MKDGYIDGLRKATETFTRKLDRSWDALEKETNAEPPSSTRVAFFRGQMRAYADVVGGLKLEAENALKEATGDQSIGGPSANRFALSLSIDETLENAEVLREQISGGYNPANRNDLAEHLEIAERNVDQACRDYASDDIS